MTMTIEETVVYCKEMAAGMTDCGCRNTYKDVARWLEELQVRRGVEGHQGTFRERLAEEYPKAIDPIYFGGASGCPVHFGYEKQRPNFCQGGNEEICTKCWDREISVPREEGDLHADKFWINTSEKLPDDSDEVVLVIASGEAAKNITFEDGAAFATYDSGEGWFFVDYPDANMRVSWWAHIPLIPKEDIHHG